MFKETVTLDVKQSVRYPQNNEFDQFDQRGIQASFYQLSTYSKLVYKNQDGQGVEVKLYPLKDGDYQVEVKQAGGGHFVFLKDKVTYTPYQTSQGAWELEVRVKNLEVAIVDQHLDLSLSYQLMLDDTLLGDYDYTLSTTTL